MNFSRFFRELPTRLPNLRLLVVLLLLLSAGTREVSAATITVTSTADSGTGSLRRALMFSAANDLIVFDPSLAGQTIHLTSGELFVARNLTIRGLGADLLTLSADGLSRVFNVDTTQATISDLTITGGFVGGTDPFSPGGGGILNLSQLTLERCHITGNHAEFRGGGVASYFGLVLDSCTISSNTVHSSTQAVTGNAGNALGGGVFGAATILFKNTTISGNQAVHDGGLFNIFPAARGGGVHLDGSGSPQFQSCTIVSNRIVLVPRPGLGLDGLAWGGGVNLQGPPISSTFINCIVAGNTLAPASVPCGPDVGCGGTISLGHNFVGVGPSGFVNGVNGDQSGTAQNPLNPKLGPLQYNTGPTPTHALLKHSPAVNAGDSTVATALDQRGQPRLVGSAIDIGAVEKAPRIVQCPPDLQVCNTAGQCTGSTFFGQPVMEGDDPTELLGFNYSRFPGVPLPLGTTPVTCTVVDLDGLQDTCVFQVVVTDCEVPVIQSISPTPGVLSPANGQLVPVSISVAASDCSLPVTSRIRRVTANQTLASGDVQITGALTLKLRANNSSFFQSRVYTIDLTHTDAAGNRATQATTVTVP